MSAFDLVFAVFGLLLGLAVAEVLGGFARALKLKRGTRPIRIGWLTPLLGIVLMLDLTGFWLMAWEARDQLGANYVTLIAVLAIVGTYYLAASLLFPDDPEAWPDFDDWYDRQNGLVIGGLLSANVGSWIGQITLEIMSPTPETPTNDIALAAAALGGLGIVAILIALLKVKAHRWNVTMLIALIVLLPVVAVAEEFA